MSKLRVGVVFGGKSAEHEVSLQSAKNIVEAIDKNRFDVVLFGVDKQGQWHVHDINHYLLNADNPSSISLNPSSTEVAQVVGKQQNQWIDAGNAAPIAAMSKPPSPHPVIVASISARPSASLVNVEILHPRFKPAPTPNNTPPSKLVPLSV